jgi:hypothetical protein
MTTLRDWLAAHVVDSKMGSHRANSVKAYRVTTLGMRVRGSFRSRRVFEASQDTHANVEISVFRGLLMDGGQSSRMLDWLLGQSFPKFEKL